MSAMPDPQNFQRASKVSDVDISGMRVDTYLTNFSMRWSMEADQFIAPRASTPIPVRHESDKYLIYPRGYFWRDEAEVRPLGGRPVQVSYKTTSGQYLAEEYALEHTIDDRQRANVESPFDLDEAGVSLLQSKQMIRQDRIWAAAVFQAGVWAHDFAGVTDFAQLDDVAVDPIATMNRFKRLLAKGSGFRPNTGVLGANVIDLLEIHPSLIERVKYTQRGILTTEILAAMFGLDRLIVAESMVNLAPEDNTVEGGEDFEYIVDENSFWLGYIEPAARMNSPTAVARFAWTGLIPGATNNSGGVITRGRDSRAYSDWIHSRNAFDIKVVAPDLGLFFSNAVGGAVSG